MKLKLICLALLLTIAFTACASPTVATVNGTAISASEFEDRYTFDTYLWTQGMGPEGVSNTEAAGELVLKTMIDEIIVRQKAEEAGITVDALDYQAAAQELLGPGGLDQIIALTVQNTDLSEDRVTEFWEQQIKGVVLASRLAEHHQQPFEELLIGWHEDAEIEVSDQWESFIPRE